MVYRSWFFYLFLFNWLSRLYMQFLSIEVNPFEIRRSPFQDSCVSFYAAPISESVLKQFVFFFETIKFELGSSSPDLVYFPKFHLHSSIHIFS